MPFETLAWFFVAAITLHNLEEAIWLPQWSRSAGRWHVPVDPFVFRFAVAVLTLAAFAVAAFAMANGKQSTGAYLLAGYALAMLLNVVFPHLIATLATRRYAPGTATALLLNAPVCTLLLLVALEQEYVVAATFKWAGPAIVIAIALSIPLLFIVGGWIRPLYERATR